MKLINENKRESKRLLVLTSASGAGHDSHAFATVAWCRQLYGSEVEVTIAHALEDSHPVYRHGVDFYNFIQRRAPWFHHIYYNVVELLEVLNPGTVSLGRDYYIRLLERVRPHAILSVMDCLNRGYFEVAREVLGPEVKCATYCTEFGGGYGFSRNWVNPRGDFFFARTEDAAATALRRGMARERTLTVGHWAPPAFYSAAMNAAEKASYLRDTLGLDPSRFTLLLSTGGAGAQNHRAIIRSLLSLGEHVQVIALCGRNAQAQAHLESWSKDIPIQVRALSFTDEMAKLLQVSSAVVARAGATTSGEALLCNCPIIFNAIGLIMPQELPTWRYFRKHGIGFVAFRAAQIRSIVEQWLDRPDEFAELRLMMQSVRCMTNPGLALAKLLGAAAAPVVE
jgi:processive 1,2-diacylglycerol beta-glucosyltransferase